MNSAKKHNAVLSVSGYDKDKHCGVILDGVVYTVKSEHIHIKGENMNDITAKELFDKCHQQAVKGGWWNDPNTGQPVDRNKGELLSLIHSEVSEALEGERKGLKDHHLPHRMNAEVELADAIIRIADYAGGFGYDLIGAMLEKMEYNARRSDHKPESRVREGGKKF